MRSMPREDTASVRARRGRGRGRGATCPRQRGKRRCVMRRRASAVLPAYDIIDVPDWRCCSSAALLHCRPTLPHRRCVVASSLRCPSPRSATGTPLRFARTRVAAHRRTASSALRCVARAPLHCSAAFKRRCLRRRGRRRACAAAAGVETACPLCGAAHALGPRQRRCAVATRHKVTLALRLRL